MCITSSDMPRHHYMAMQYVLVYQAEFHCGIIVVMHGCDDDSMLAVFALRSISATRILAWHSVGCLEFRFLLRSSLVLSAILVVPMLGLYSVFVLSPYAVRFCVLVIIIRHSAALISLTSSLHALGKAPAWLTCSRIWSARTDCPPIVQVHTYNTKHMPVH
jgi:hypothetical protein